MQTPRNYARTKEGVRREREGLFFRSPLPPRLFLLLYLALSLSLSRAAVGRCFMALEPCGGCVLDDVRKLERESRELSWLVFCAAATD